VIEWHAAAAPVEPARDADLLVAALRRADEPLRTTMTNANHGLLAQGSLGLARRHVDYTLKKPPAGITPTDSST